MGGNGPACTRTPANGGSLRSILFIFWLCCCTTLQAEQREILLYSYQQKPPYVVDAGRRQGLYFDLAERLEAQMPDYRFTVQEIPRRRLDLLLQQGQLDGLVVGVSPDWFADATRYRWSHAFIDDGNLLVSRSEGEVSRLGIDDLAGRRLGLVGGHAYPELQAVLASGKTERQNANSELANLERLLRGWIDATVVGMRTLDYQEHQQPGLRGRIHVAEPVLYRYPRQLLVPARYEKLLPALDKAIDALPSDPVWLKRQKHYFP